MFCLKLPSGSRPVLKPAKRDICNIRHTVSLLSSTRVSVEPSVTGPIQCRLSRLVRDRAKEELLTESDSRSTLCFTHNGQGVLASLCPNRPGTRCRDNARLFLAGRILHFLRVNHGGDNRPSIHRRTAVILGRRGAPGPKRRTSVKTKSACIVRVTQSRTGHAAIFFKIHR